MRTPGRSTARSLALLAFTVAAAPSSADTERWYTVELSGQKCGHMVEREGTDDKGQLVSTEEVVFSLSRMSAKVQIKMETRFVETAEGKPVSMSSKQDLGLMQLNSEYRFTDTGVEEIVSQGGKSSTRQLPPIQGEWLTPGKVHELVKSKLVSGDKTITYATIDPSQNPTPFTVTSTVLDPHATAQADGKSVPAVKWETQTSILPGVKETELVDAEGYPIVSKTEIGGNELTFVLSDKQAATSSFDAPQMMANTTVPADRPIKNPRDSVDVQFNVSTTQGELPALPTTASQRSTRNGENSCLVKVTPKWPVEEPQKGMQRYLAATKACDSTDPAITDLVKQALAKPGPNRWENVKLLRSFVNSYIQKKDLDVGFATASEVARTRQGDCTEHAVLLAAMLRAAGVGSRVASGLIYVDDFEGQKNVFVYHMWTQAYLENVDGALCWQDVDATLPSGKTMDAAHICLTTSSLGDDDTLNSMVAVAQLTGRLQIKVMKTDDDGMPSP